VSEIAVRTAIIHDATAVQALLEDALAGLGALRGGAELLTSIGVPATVAPEVLASALCGSALLGTTTFVAELTGAVVGVATVQVTPGGVDLLGVHAARSVRRRGVGTALLDASSAFARASGARFDAIALPGDQSTKSLFESAGFKARQLRMSAGR
jgi:ribosomal protein S18 acetylase RimI-like enzyme